MNIDRFISILESEYDLDSGSVKETDLLVVDLAFDSLDLFRLALIAESISPGFEMPEQMDLNDVRVADVYHYMTGSNER